MPPEDMTLGAPAMDEGGEIEFEEGFRRRWRVKRPGETNRMYLFLFLVPFSFCFPLFSFCVWQNEKEIREPYYGRIWD